MMKSAWTGKTLRYGHLFGIIVIRSNAKSILGYNSCVSVTAIQLILIAGLSNGPCLQCPILWLSRRFLLQTSTDELEYSGLKELGLFESWIVMYYILLNNFSKLNIIQGHIGGAITCGCWQTNLLRCIYRLDTGNAYWYFPKIRFNTIQYKNDIIYEYPT